MGGGVRRSAVQKQQQAQAAAEAAAAASRNRNTNNKKSSNKQQNQEQHRQQPRKVRANRCGSRRWGGGRLPVEFRSVVFEAFFSGCKQNQILLVIDFFGSLGKGHGGNQLQKLFLTFCKSRRSFTRQTVSPNVHSWHRRFKHHQNSTKRPPKRGRKNEN